MTKNLKSWIYPLFIVGVFLILSNSCKKNEDGTTSDLTANGNGIIFNPNLKYGTVSDKDGNIYKTVTIGIQTWMAENLKTTKYNDGTAIPLITDNTAWKNLTTPSYCWYKNDESTYKNSYGALYNWYSVNSGNLCPSGWHAPSDNEWSILTSYLGGEFIAGGKLKETGTSHWLSPNTGATNDIGFSALPGGIRAEAGTFSYLGFYGHWWSTTDTNIPGVSIVKDWAWYRTLRNDGIGVDRSSYYWNKRFAYSVRCVKD